MSLLQLESVTVHFGGVFALRAVSLAVQPGEIHAVIGPNGAGKTTLINVVTGVVGPQEGRVLLDGKDVTRLAPHRIARLGLGRTFQHAEPFGECSVLQNVLTAFDQRLHYGLTAAVLGLGSARREERDARQQAESLLRAFGLFALRDAIVANLPFGLLKRMDLVRAIAAQPRLLLMDEPTSGMSEAEAADSIAALRALVRERGITLVLIEHNMRVVMALADRISALNFGELIATGTPAEVQSNAAVIDAYLGEAANA